MLEKLNDFLDDILLDVLHDPEGFATLLLLIGGIICLVYLVCRGAGLF